MVETWGYTSKATATTVFHMSKATATIDMLVRPSEIEGSWYEFLLK